MCSVGILALLAHADMTRKEVATKLAELGANWSSPFIEHVALFGLNWEGLIRTLKRERGAPRRFRDRRFRITQRGRQELLRIQVIWMKNREATERALRDAFRATR